MKRYLCIAAALLIAALFALPAAAIAGLDGSDPVFEGEAGIVPLMDSVEVIGEPADDQVYIEPVDRPIDRSHLARSGERPIQAYAVLALAAFSVLSLLGLTSLALSVIALVKFGRMEEKMSAA